MHKNKEQMDIIDFIEKHCVSSCDMGGQVDCGVSFEGDCAKSRALNIEIIGSNGD